MGASGMNMMEIWFWKPIGEFLGNVALLIAVVLGILIYVLLYDRVDHFILKPLRTRREKKNWANQSLEWQKNWYQYHVRNNTTEPWMLDMIKRHDRSKNVCGND